MKKEINKSINKNKYIKTNKYKNIKTKDINRVKIHIILVICIFIVSFSFFSMFKIFGNENTNINPGSVNGTDSNEGREIPSSSEQNQPGNLTLSEQKRIVEQSIEEAENRKTNLGIDIDKNAMEVLEYERQISEQILKIGRLAEQEEEYTTQFQKIEKELKYLNSQEEILDKKAKEKLAQIYMKSSYSNWEILLSSGSFSEFTSNLEALKRLAEIDLELLNSASENTRKARKQAEAHSVKFKELQETKLNLSKAKVLQENLKKIKDDRILELTEEERRLYLQLEDLENKRKEIETEIARSLTQYGKIPVYVGGTFEWPVPSCRSPRWITAYYAAGYANGYPGSFHSGVDIAPPRAIVGSATANAVADGRVITAGYSAGGYGNYIVIDHGGDVYTLYGHASKLLVSAGEMVQKGQPILIIGSTGFSTGPHLHFEVRLGGSSYRYHVDPLPYITTPKEPAQIINKEDFENTDE